MLYAGARIPMCALLNLSFPKEEERILEYWQQTDAFHEQLKRTEGNPEYIFYGGEMDAQCFTV